MKKKVYATIATTVVGLIIGFLLAYSNGAAFIAAFGMPKWLSPVALMGGLGLGVGAVLSTVLAEVEHKMWNFLAFGCVSTLALNLLLGWNMRAGGINSLLFVAGLGVILGLVYKLGLKLKITA